MARKPHAEPLPDLEPTMLAGSVGLYPQASATFQEAGPASLAQYKAEGQYKEKAKDKDVIPWSAEDDLALLRRIVRLLEPVPNGPRKRIKAYLFEYLSEEIPF